MEGTLLCSMWLPAVIGLKGRMKETQLHSDGSSKFKPLGRQTLFKMGKKRERERGIRVISSIMV